MVTNSLPSWSRLPHAYATPSPEHNVRNTTFAAVTPPVVLAIICAGIGSIETLTVGSDKGCYRAAIIFAALVIVAVPIGLIIGLFDQRKSRRQEAIADARYDTRVQTRVDEQTQQIVVAAVDRAGNEYLQRSFEYEDESTAAEYVIAVEHEIDDAYAAHLAKPASPVSGYGYSRSNPLISR